MRLKLSSRLTVTPIIKLYLMYRLYLLANCGFMFGVWATRVWDSMYSSTLVPISRKRDSRGWPVKSLWLSPLISSMRFMAWSSPIAEVSASCITIQSHEKAPDACRSSLRSACSRITKNLWKYCILLAFFISVTSSCARWCVMLKPFSVGKSIPLSLHLWNMTSVTIARPTSPISSIPCREGQRKAVSNFRSFCSMPWISL